MTISATIIADSIGYTRLTTMELKYPRFIHAEFMTHRMFSRNASSSRAIPVERMIQDILEDPAMPIHWGRNQKGMQAREELDDPSTAKAIWLRAAGDAANAAKYMSQEGVHKQVVNRLLEPFAHIKVICTATDWENFFDLRLHPDAQPEINELALKMKIALDASEPHYVINGDWHLPYIGYEDEDKCLGILRDLKLISASRCARVSYDRSGGGGELASKLLQDGHLSPFEHIATPAEGRHANFNGWKSFRQELGQ
jgi:hypothetical protein